MLKFFACGLVMILIVLVDTEAGRIDSENYISFLSDLVKYHKSSGIFLLYNDQYSKRLEAQASIAEVSRQLSALGVLSQAVVYSQIATPDGSSRLYLSGNIRCTLVTLLVSADDFASFRKSTDQCDMSFHPWFVVLAESVDEETSHEVGEWNSLRENQMSVVELANWRAGETGIIRRITLRQNRYGLRGKVVRIAVNAIGSNGRLSEFFEQVLGELELALNFSQRRVKQVDAFNKLPSLMRSLANREADLVPAPLTISQIRLDYVGFTKPLFLSPSRIYLRQPDGVRVQWSAYFRAFSMSSWSFIVLTLITASLMTAFIRIIVRESNFLKMTTNYFMENFICIWGIYCQQGVTVSEFTSAIPLRLAYFTTLLLTLVIWSIYSASITSYLTVLTPTLPFSDIDGFIEDGSFRIIVLQNSSDQDLIWSGKDSLLTKLQPLLKNFDELPTSPIAGFNQVCEEKVGFYASEAVYDDMSHHVPCALAFIETGRSECLAMALTKHSPYITSINYHLQKLEDSGVMRRLKNQYLVKVNNAPEPTHSPIGLSGVAPLLAIFTSGLAVSLLVLLLERLCHSSSNSNKQLVRVCSAFSIYAEI